MQFDDKFIGAHLIEIITSGLYDGNLNCLREYVQNAIDAKAENIDIYFENENTNLLIKDDGTGMDYDELIHSLSIGISTKTGEAVGWRGIGIWSGVPVCKRIVIITKKKGDKKYRIEIDNNEIRNLIGSKASIKEILTNSTGDIEDMELGSDESLENDHYTILRLEEILATQRDVFDKNAIKKYLCRVAPAPFDESKFSFASEIEEWLKEKNVPFPEVKIKFESEELFRPPTRDDIFFDNVIPKEFIVAGKTVAVAWILTSNKNIALKDLDKGIYFKKKGFTIGNENLVRNLYSGSYHDWQYGEIHIVSEDIIENAARNNFELNSGLVSDFLVDVGIFVKSLEDSNQYQSNKNIGINVEKACALIENNDIPAAKKELVKLEKRLTRKRKFPTDPEFSGLKDILDREYEINKDNIESLKNDVKKPRPESSRLKAKKERLNTVVDGLPPAVRASVKRSTSKGLLYPEISAMDPIRELLQKKTGLNKDIKELTMDAYGWGDIKLKSGTRLLTLGNKSKNHRDARLGLMIYTIQDIFINMCKHDQGKDSFKWFEDNTEEEKYEIMSELYALIGLICRLVEKSEKY